MLLYAVSLALVIIFSPSDAHAWGPGMHVETALYAIANIGLAAPFIRKLIQRFPDAFIYGTASPDIVLGKKFAGYIHHCHNWRVGWLVLHEAKTDRERAAAYGYLTHLAADVVAHNYFIPAKIIRSYRTRLLSHTYWEMRFDLGVSDEVWDRLKIITKMDAEDFDTLLERVLRKTIFSFSTNKRIFNSILKLQKMKGMRKSLQAYAKRSRFGIEGGNREHYVELVREAVMDFLSHPESAEVLAVDPAGLSRLTYAKNLRRRMREMIQIGMFSHEEADKLVELAREGLAMGLYRPDMMLPDVVDVLGERKKRR